MANAREDVYLLVNSKIVFSKKSMRNATLSVHIVIFLRKYVLQLTLALSCNLHYQCDHLAERKNVAAHLFGQFPHRKSTPLSLFKVV